MGATVASVSVGRWPSTSNNQTHPMPRHRSRRTPPYAQPANAESVRVSAMANPSKLATTSTATYGAALRRSHNQNAKQPAISKTAASANTWTFELMRQAAPRMNAPAPGEPREL